MTASLDLPPHTRLVTGPTGPAGGGVAFAVAVPEAWEVLPDVDGTTVLAAREPDHAGSRAAAFRANLVVTADRVGELSFDTWQRGTDHILDASLTGWVLLDLEPLEVDGHPAVRRLGTYVAPDGPPVTLEQWAVLRDGTGCTLSVTVATSAWDSLADQVSAIGAAFRVEAAS